MSKRITVEEVVTAFEVTGLKPYVGSYFGQKEQPKDCACGLGAVFQFREGRERVEENSTDITDYFNNIFGENYRLGFVHGFDGHPKKSQLSLEYNAGYAVGKASREALKVTEVAQ